MHVERNDGKDKEMPKLQVEHLLVDAARRCAATIESSVHQAFGMAVCFAAAHRAGTRLAHRQLSVNTSLFDSNKE